jgi:NADH:ubiquinone oxidoreductase subunit 5 (subunit L)/multisubunit Na+/H+ antiporter MnhA subunit
LVSWKSIPYLLIYLYTYILFQRILPNFLFCYLYWYLYILICIVSQNSIYIIINISEISLLHLFYHGWSKSLIFIVSGYLISLLHSQDIRFFGSLFQHIPIFFIIVNICLLTIFGFPGSYLSYSKDIILEFGLISIYGYNIILIFFMILLLSQGYSLGILLFLIIGYISTK